MSSEQQQPQEPSSISRSARADAEDPGSACDVEPPAQSPLELSDVDEEAVEAILGEVVEQVTPRVVEQVEVEIRNEYFRGPLPPPEVLENYERIIPGFSERALSQWERQTNHRQVMEAKVVDASIKAQSRGQWIAGTIAIVGLLIAGAVGIWGHPLVGAGIAVADLGSLVGVFVWGKREQRRQTSPDPDPEEAEPEIPRSNGP